MEASLRWMENMLFECDNHGLKTAIDATTEAGGGSEAPTPKELVLNAMMGCSAMDVIAILRKMRLAPTRFEMKINAEKSSEHPIHFTKATLFFNLTGDVPAEKIIKAVDASLTKYCGVNFMISQTCDIDFKVTLNGNMIHQGKVNFSS
jgi:putative redox protein